MRLDKFLGNMGVGSRKEVKALCKKGHVRVNGEVQKDSSFAVDENVDRIFVDGDEIHYQKYIYLMLNKPTGVISATEDSSHRTVLDLVDEKYAHYDLAPVGRLDIDTVGLLLLTNDGEQMHRWISPKSKVEKEYLVKIDKELSEEAIRRLEAGVYLEAEDYTTLPASVVSVAPLTYRMIIMEGKFHQIKRMMKSEQAEVVYLKRVRMGSLDLDEALDEGLMRELTTEEVEQLIDCAQSKKNVDQ